ncbi:MAG: cation diffusion facilitator family transporter, partial [Eubacteriales bacterium]
IVKAILSIFFTRISKKVNSKTLYATGIDALYDAILSSAVLSCVIISMKQGRYYEAWVSAFISLFIIKSGIEMMKEGLDEILGKRASTSLVNAIKDAVCKDMQVKGAYDLFLYNYGPDRYYGSVHVEVFETLSARDIDSLTRRIQEKIYKDYGVILTAIGIYAVSGDASIESDIRRKVYDTVMAHPEAKQVHGFYLDGESKKFIFDVVLSFDCNAQKVVDEIKAELNSMYPDFEQDMTVDLDVS